MNVFRRDKFTDDQFVFGFQKYNCVFSLVWDTFISYCCPFRVSAYSVASPGIGQLYEKIVYVIRKLFCCNDQAFGLYKPSYFGDTVSDRLFDDYFPLAHFLISFLLWARASLIVSVFSGLLFRAAFFCSA
jgi:hypothetical protein